MEEQNFMPSDEYKSDRAYMREIDILYALGKIGDIGFISNGISCSIEYADRYGAIGKFLRIYNFSRNDSVAMFFKDALKLSLEFDSYASEPKCYRIEGHKSNCVIISELLEGKYGFSIWDFFHEDQIESFADYFRWVKNPDYTRDEEKKPAPREGNVYLMRDNRSGYHKIGFTSGEPTFRESTLQAEQPDIELIWHVWKDMAYEAYLHEIFADKRVRGEWFDLDENDLQEIFEMSE